MKKKYICPKAQSLSFGPVLLYSVSGEIGGPVGAPRHLLIDDDEELFEEYEI